MSEDHGYKERRVWLMWLISKHYQRDLGADEIAHYNELRDEDIRLTGGNWISFEKIDQHKRLHFPHGIAQVIS